MIEDSNFFLKELLHGVAETDTPSKIFVVKVGNLIKDGSSAALSNLAEKLRCNFVTSCAKEDFLEVIC